MRTRLVTLNVIKKPRTSHHSLLTRLKTSDVPTPCRRWLSFFRLINVAFQKKRAAFQKESTLR